MGQALPMTTAFGTAGGVPTTNESAAATKEQSMPTISAAGAIAASAASVAATCGSVLSKDGYRSSTSTTCSSSQDDTTTLNGSECGSVYSATPPRKRTLQNASGKGTRFSAFNYVQ
ncbi:hypothetical protein DFQ27_003269 [Actinomortierella ambigua]|uniref:Uncharacterized protein n=1 Tax=Actinomortierella ambigua TaxID=1343610 RepID=A0A9P6Q6E1_9FUNG|nr:hypothetical protein DFQ27_003269 [Actinomortierella ambigua]